MKKYAAFVLLAFTLGFFSEVAQADTNCSKLGTLECWKSTQCELDCTASKNSPTACSPYLCRPKKGKCELGFSQENLTRELCLQRGRCSYLAPNCFCPGPMDCACGGGPPARCRGEE